MQRVESGESPELVAKGLGINRRTIYRWLEAYHYGGDAALAAKPIPGAPSKLNAKQMEELVTAPHSDVVVLTGAERTFSAGGDLDHIAGNAARPEQFEHEAHLAKQIVYSIRKST